MADITYIRLREQFIYLAVILDAFSRRVIGWQVGESLEAKQARTHLLLDENTPEPRGVQSAELGRIVAIRPSYNRAVPDRSVAVFTTGTSGALPESGRPRRRYFPRTVVPGVPILTARQEHDSFE